MFKFNEVSDKVTEAAKRAATATVAEAAEEAKGATMTLPPHSAAGHPWYGVTDRVENEVSSTEARVEGGQVTAQFGATKRRGDYGLMLERMNPYLRPVADRIFPRFAGRVRQEMEKD